MHSHAHNRAVYGAVTHGCALLVLDPDTPNHASSWFTPAARLISLPGALEWHSVPSSRDGLQS